MGKLRALVLACSLFSILGLAKARPPGFVVVKLSGTVLVRSPNAFRWRSVGKGMRLKEGDLVQTLPGATLSLEASGRLAGSELAADASELTINVPMILRLRHDMLRKVVMDRLFLRDLPQVALPETKPKPLTLDWDEAWKRLAAIFARSHPSSVDGGVAPHAGENAMGLAMVAKKLKLISPASDSVLSGMLPVEAKIAWLPTGEPETRYLVYVWPLDATIDAPLASTYQEVYTHQFLHYGSYNIQITTADKDWQSPVYIVHVVPVSTRTAKTRKDETPEAVVTPLLGKTIDLVYPGKSMLLIEPEKAAQVDFYWSERGPTAGVYELTLSSEQHEILQRKRITVGERHLRLSVAPGLYLWQVSRLATAVATTSHAKNTVQDSLKAAAVSEVRKLQIARPTRVQSTQAIIHNLFQRQGRGSIYLRNGL